MQTNTPLVLSANSEVKPYRFPSLLVDNLKHLSDHGMSVNFTSPKLVSLVEYLRSRDGKFTLTAGKSELIVTRLGHVTFTELFLSHGSYRIHSVHYRDGDLKSSQTRNGNADAYDTLRAVILGASGEKTERYCASPAGENLPGIWSPKFGSDQDKLRDFLRNFAGTLTGEQWLRGKAISEKLKGLKSSISCNESRLVYLQERIKNEAEFDFRAAHERLRETSTRQLSYIAKLETEKQTDKARAENWLAAALISELPTLTSIEELAGNYGSHTRYNPNGVRPYFPGIPARTVPEIMRANYSASVSASGELLLSSNVRAEFTPAELLSFLKGERKELRNRYGPVTVRNFSTPEFTPVRLVSCGCHRVDIAKDLGGEFASVLAPAFQVQHVPAVPALDYSPETAVPFFQRLISEIQTRIEGHAEERARIISETVREKHELNVRENNAPEYRANTEKEIAEKESENVSTENQISGFSTLGATAEKLNEAVKAAVLSLRSLSY